MGIVRVVSSMKTDERELAPCPTGSLFDLITVFYYLSGKMATGPFCFLGDFGVWSF